MAAKEKSEASKRNGVGVTPDVQKDIRKLQAKMQLASGERVSASDAIGAAVKAALK